MAHVCGVGRQSPGARKRRAAGIPDLGLVETRAQYLLQARLPVTTFGHARWREEEAEAADAAAWVAAGEGRGLLVGSAGREACFPDAEAVDVGRANREHWFVVTGPPDEACVARGDVGRALRYVPARASEGGSVEGPVSERARREKTP